MVMNMCAFTASRLFPTAIAAMAATAVATAPSARAAFVGDDSAQDPLVIDEFTQTLSVDTRGTSSASDELTVNGKTVSRTLNISETVIDPNISNNKGNESSIIRDGLWRVTHNNFGGLAFQRDNELVTSDLKYTAQSGESIDLSPFIELRTTVTDKSMAKGTSGEDIGGASNGKITVSLISSGSTATISDDFDLFKSQFYETKQIIMPFEDFENISAVNLANISELQITLDLIGLSDVNVSPISAVVPLPGALPLFLGGLAGVGYVVRRRQRQAAAA